MTATAALTREIADAGVGVGRLIRYDPRWPDGFDPTATGFLRSFLGPILALPFYLVTAYMLARAGAENGAVGAPVLWAAGISHLGGAVLFPLVVALLARPFGFGGGYAGFIIVVNWASLFLNMAAAAASALNLAGAGGYALFGLVWLALFAVSLFVTWRAARETLSSEIPPALLMVVLSVAVGVATERAAEWAFGVPPS
jgi:hypothetical protein